MSFGALLELYDNWNGRMRVNDDRQETIVEDRTVYIYDNRKDLLNRPVISFGFYDDIFTVRVAD